MSKMSEIHLKITEYLEQGDNVYRIASVMQVPLEWVQEIEKEVRIAEAASGWFLTVDGKNVYQEFPNDSFDDVVHYG